MSDAAAPVAEPAFVPPPDSQTAPPVSQTAPQPPPPPEPEPESDPLVDPFDYGQQQFDRRYVEKLRGEAASKRMALREVETKLGRYEQALGQLAPDDQDALLGFAQLLVSDPNTAATWMVETGNALQQQFADAQAALNPDQPAPMGETLTRAEVEQMLAQHQAAQQAEQRKAEMIGHWNREATRLGYNPFARADAPEGPKAWIQFQSLVKMAEITGGNLEQAHQMLLAQAQAGANAQIQQRAEAVRSQMTGLVPPSERPEPTGNESSSQRWQRINDAVRERMNGEQIT